MREIIFYLLYVFYMVFAVFTFLNGSETLAAGCLVCMFFQFFVQFVIALLEKKMFFK